MVDKVLRLKDGTRYYILDELTQNSKKFIFGVECDLYNNTNKDNYIILELLINENKLVVKDIDDIDTLKDITEQFLSNLKSLSEDL